MKKEKSIEDYMRELDQLDAAGELDDDEPMFQGHTLNLTKWETYQHIKNALEGLLDTSQHIKAVRGYSTPYSAEQDATIAVTVSKMTLFTEVETAVLADAMAKADQFGISALENSVFLNFVVNKIWIDQESVPALGK